MAVVAKDTTFEDVEVEATVSGTKFAGGFVASAGEGTNNFLRCKSDSKLSVMADPQESGVFAAGGLVAHSFGKTNFTRCENRGAVQAEARNADAAVYCGGLIGYSEDLANLTDSINSASIEAMGEKCYFAGLVGYGGGLPTRQMVIYNCTNEGDVKNKENDPQSGSAMFTFAAGLISKVDGCTLLVKNSVSKGNVEAQTGTASGLIGEISSVATVESCRITGTIKGVGTATAFLGNSKQNTDYHVYRNSAALARLEAADCYGIGGGAVDAQEVAIGVSYSCTFKSIHKEDGALSLANVYELQQTDKSTTSMSKDLYDDIYYDDENNLVSDQLNKYTEKKYDLYFSPELDLVYDITVTLVVPSETADANIPIPSMFPTIRGSTTQVLAPSTATGNCGKTQLSMLPSGSIL